MKRLLIPSFIAIVVFVHHGSCQVLTPQVAAHRLSPNHPILKLNQIAAASKYGGPDAIREVVNAAAKVEGIPPDLISTFAERIVQAEEQFRNGQIPPIDEQKVVDVVNVVAKKFNGPAYAYTNIKEVRRLRARLMLLTPEIISRESVDPARSDRSGSISSKLTPVEAFHVAAMMIRQKILNPDFQLAPGELLLSQASGGLQMAQKSNFEASRSREMLTLVTKHMATASISDLLQLGSESITILGIK